MARYLYIAALLTAALLYGCPTDDPCNGPDCSASNGSQTTGPECESSMDCSIGFSCINSKCQRPSDQCNDDSDCASEKQCVSNECVDRPRPDMGMQDADASTPDNNNGERADFVICQEFKDFQADDVIDQREFYEYGEGGRLEKREFRDADGSQDDYVEVYSYDERGLLIRIERDELVDGTFDRRESFQYDAEMRLTVEERDTDLDGDPNYRRTFEYGADGLLSVINSDTGGDGTINSLWRFTWDVNGYHREVIWDLRADGDGDARYTFEHDAEGVLLRYERDSNFDGGLEERITYTYDDDKALVTKQSDRNDDGVIDDTWNFVYDETPLNFDVDFISELQPAQSRWLPSYRPPNRPTVWERFDEEMVLKAQEIITYEEIDDAVQMTVETDFQGDGELNTRIVYLFDLPENCGQ